MRRLAAILMLVVFASLNAIDGICCPDGCTHEEQASSSPRTPSTDGICLLCTGGLSSPIPEDLSPGIPVITVVTNIAMTEPNDVPPDPPDHPPRA